MLIARNEALPEGTDRGGVGHLVVIQGKANKPDKGEPFVQSFFHRRVTQIVPTPEQKDLEQRLSRKSPCIGLKLSWDRNGFCLWQKRLECHVFRWPTREAEGGPLTPPILDKLRARLDARAAAPAQRKAFLPQHIDHSA